MRSSQKLDLYGFRFGQVLAKPRTCLNSGSGVVDPFGQMFQCKSKKFEDILDPLQVCQVVRSKSQLFLLELPMSVYCNPKRSRESLVDFSSR